MGQSGDWLHAGHVRPRRTHTSHLRRRSSYLRLLLETHAEDDMVHTILHVNNIIYVYSGGVNPWIRGSVPVLFWNLHSRGERGSKF